RAPTLPVCYASRLEPRFRGEGKRGICFSWTPMCVLFLALFARRGIFRSSQFCYPDRSRSSQSDDLGSGGTCSLDCGWVPVVCPEYPVRQVRPFGVARTFLSSALRGRSVWRGCRRFAPGAPCLAFFARRGNPYPAIPEKSILSNTSEWLTRTGPDSP